jgi:hypothetical protein
MREVQESADGKRCNYQRTGDNNFLFHDRPQFTNETFQQPIPVVRHWKLLVVAVVAVDGDATAGTVGITGARLPATPTVGDTVIVGTAAAELTPRLLISVDPIGIPVRATPPGAVGAVDVGVDDEVMLIEPEPHIPDDPDVSSIPELVDIPDAADPDDIDVADVATVEDVVPVGVPPPSKVEVDPNISAGAVPTVEHDVPLLAIVPVVEVGIGLTPREAISVEPIGIPVMPTGAPGPLPSGEVMPSEGVAVTVPTWAMAGLQHNKGQAVATIRKGFIGDPSGTSRVSHVRINRAMRRGDREAP